MLRESQEKSEELIVLYQAEEKPAHWVVWRKGTIFQIFCLCVCMCVSVFVCVCVCVCVCV